MKIVEVQGRGRTGETCGDGPAGPITPGGAREGRGRGWVGVLRGGDDKGEVLWQAL